MGKHTVRNTAPGPRGLNTGPDGTVYVELAPGQTLEGVEINDAELKSAKTTGNFHFDKDAAADDKADDKATSGEGLPSNPMQLKKLARDEGIDVGGANSAADLQRAILSGRQAKVDQAKGNEGGDDLDAMDDDTLRTTTAAITGKSVDELADTPRDDLLKLARAQ